VRYQVSHPNKTTGITIFCLPVSYQKT
jgi:hypothetical protein